MTDRTRVELGLAHQFVEGSGPRTLLLLHGTGGNEDDLLPLGRMLDPEANLLSPRGQVLENGMPRFFRRKAMGVFDLEDLERRTYELGSFVEDAARTYGFNLEEVVVVGYSNGANIGASLLLRQPGLVRAAALLHAMIPFRPDELPDLSSTSVLISGGRRDPMIPTDLTEALARLLSDAGASVTIKWQPGGHQLTPAEVEETKNWLRRLAGGSRASRKPRRDRIER